MYKALQLATLPSKPIPAGCYLVHSHNGFRAWIQTRSDNLMECDCNFGDCENSKLHKRHHRVERRAVEQRARGDAVMPFAIGRLSVPGLKKAVTDAPVTASSR